MRNIRLPIRLPLPLIANFLCSDLATASLGNASPNPPDISIVGGMSNLAGASPSSHCCTLALSDRPRAGGRWYGCAGVARCCELGHTGRAGGPSDHWCAPPPSLRTHSKPRDPDPP